MNAQTMILDLKSAVLFAGFAIAAALGHAAEGGLNGYDFSYAIAGDSRGTPIQVFDDGAQTFFQFKAAENVPAIFLLNKGRQELAQVTARSPYFVVSGLGQRFSLRSGTAIASVDYVGGRRNEPVLPTARGAADTPAPKSAPAPAGDAERQLAMIQNLVSELGARRSEDRAAQPVESKETTTVPFHRGKSTLGPRGNRTMAKIAQSAGSAEAVMITGRGDPNDLELGTDRAMTLRSFLTGRGVPVQKIRLAEGQAARASGSKDVYLSEVTLVAPAAVDSRRDVSAGISAQREGGRVSSAPTPRSLLPANLLPLASATIALLNEGTISREAAAEILGRVLRSQGDPKPAHAVASKPVWEISPTDGTLRNAFARWAGAAGWQLSWDAPVDYPIDVRATFQGSFDEAVGSVATALESADVPLQVTFYRANKVLRVLAAQGPSK